MAEPFEGLVTFTNVGSMYEEVSLYMKAILVSGAMLNVVLLLPRLKLALVIVVLLLNRLLSSIVMFNICLTFNAELLICRFMQCLF